MGIFTGIKTLFTSTSKGLDIAETGVNSIIAGIDKMKFTQEEKFDAWKDVAKVHLDILKETASESTERSITRRILAIILIGDYVLLMTYAAIIYKWFPSWATYIVELANNTNLGKLAFWFGIFYVGYYGVSNIIDHTKKK